MKKSYTLFIVWIVLFCVVETGICFLPVSVNLMLRLVMNTTSISVALLTLLIYLTGNVHWYTGISFQDAVAAGPVRRKNYALKHLIRFGAFALIYLLFSVVMQILHVSFWVDFAVFMVGIMAAAFSTIRVRL